MERLNLTDTTTWNAVIIDDEPDNIGIVKLVFDFHGIQSRDASSGDDGLALLREKAPTFVLLDLLMPKRSGYDVLKDIRSDPQLASLPVIAFTAYAMPEERQRAMDAGFDGHITKPISIATFLNEVREVLANKVNISSTSINPNNATVVSTADTVNTALPADAVQTGVG